MSKALTIAGAAGGRVAGLVGSAWLPGEGVAGRPASWLQAFLQHLRHSDRTRLIRQMGTFGRPPPFPGGGWVLICDVNDEHAWRRYVSGPASEPSYDQTGGH